jgi:hypothetical protein
MAVEPLLKDVEFDKTSPIGPPKPPSLLGHRQEIADRQQLPDRRRIADRPP